MFGVFLFRNITRISLLYSEYHICERKDNLESPEKEECKPLLPATGLSTMPLGTNKEGTSMHYETQDGSLYTQNSKNSDKIKTI